MNSIIERIRAWGAVEWVRIVQALNAAALTLGGAIIAINEMYPDEIKDAAASLPPAVKLGALIAWAGIVHYALRRAAKAA